MRRLVKSACAVAVVGLWRATALANEGHRDWPAYHGSLDNAHYSSLTQINRGNVKELEIAWTLDTGDHIPGSEMYCNPLVIDAVIYVLSPKLNLIAANAATGKELWRFDPSNGRRAIGKHRKRGLQYWSDGKQGRIFFSARQYLYAIDAKTGKPVSSFGTAGRIDLREHLDRDPASQSITLNTPGVIYKDLLIIGSTVSEGLPAAYGDIRAYDVRTGALRWTFHTVPRPGEFGYETWPKDTWKHTGGVNSWGGMSLDEKRGIVYVPTGSATYDWYGADRAGDNLFANTLLALDARTGKRLWHFQTVHHDTLDRDLPSAPTLVTVMREGRPIDAVAQPTKAGSLFVFDRVSGQPLFPIEERAVPQEALPGEVLSRTQPFPVKPAPFTRQLFTEEMITDRTPEARSAVLKKFRALRKGGPFMSVTLQGTILLPSSDGGAEWGGAAWDHETGLFYINANDAPWYARMEQRKPAGTASSGRELYLRECAACHGADRKGSSGLFPSLVDIGEHYTAEEVAAFVAEGSGRMPGFAHLGPSLYAIVDYLMSGKNRAVSEATSASALPYEPRYTLSSLNRLQDPDGYPGIKPPWGTLSAIDLNTGEYAWRIPLGEYPALAAQGLPDTGTENYGGPVVTAGGIVFIGATIYDKKFRAFDKLTGQLLWETILPAAAHATPAVYEVDGRQFVVIAAGGGKAGAFSDVDTAAPKRDESGATYIAFALPKP